MRGSKAAKGHKTYPYLLGGLRIDRPNQVWCRDITVSGAQRLFVSKFDAVFLALF